MESRGKEAEKRGRRSRGPLVWQRAVAVIFVIGAGLASLAIWLTDSSDPPPAVPEVEIPPTPGPIPEVETPAPAPTALLPEVAGLDEASDAEVAFGRINITLADGTELLFRLPGISDNSEVSLWDQTQFVVDGLAVSIYFESCTDRGYGAASSNERGQRLRFPEPSIVILCATHFPLSAVLFSGDDWRAEELEQLEMQLWSVGSDLAFVTEECALSSGACHYPSGPLRTDQFIAFSQLTLGGTVMAIDPESGDPAWELSLGDTSFLLAATDDTLLAGAGKGSVTAIDAKTGAENWRAEFGAHAGVAKAVAIGEGDWLVALSFSAEGDSSPPQLARLDAQGTLRWTAAGREGTDWDFGPPIASGSRVFMRDVPHAWADAGRASVTAFDTESGELLWRTELDTTAEGYSSDSLVHSQGNSSFLIAIIHEKKQIVRLDASTGEIEWTAEKPPGRVISVRKSSIRFDTSRSQNQYAINARNGLPWGPVG